VARRISLEIQSIAVGLEGAVSIQGVPVAVEGIVNVKVADDEDAIRQAAQRFLDSQKGISEIVRNVMEGSLRTIIGQLTVEQLIRDREVFTSRVQEVANGDLEGTGLAIDVFTIQSITDSEHYIENLGRMAAALVRRDAEIAEAEAAQAAREKQETAKQAILQAEKVTRLRQQAIEEEVSGATARAEQAKPLAEATARKEVVTTETEVADLVARRRDKELDSEVRRTADAERYATEQGAEAERYQAVASAEARALAVRVEAEAAKDRRLLEAEAERANIEAVAAGNAFNERESGKAKAEATLAVGQAEAEAMEKKAEAYKQYEDAATLELLISRLPEVARAVAEPIGKVKDITIIGTEGAGALPRMAANTIKELDGVLESFTGASLSQLVGRYLNGGDGRARETPPKADDTSREREGQP
jgi:flotillin